MRYYKIIDGQTVFFREPLIVGDMAVFNHTEEMILAEGWQVYVEPTPEPQPPQPQLEPNEYKVVEKVKTMMLPQIEQFTDEQALNVVELYPTWIGKMGKQVNVGERLYYDTYLWKVMQSHTVQDDWTPDVATSLFTKVTRDAGTIDNPIEFSLNMELIEGKYYVEDGVEYLCTRSLAQSVWHLADLVGQYVEEVEP